MSEIVRTGSISQDALRMGFQTTCAKGIAKLLKVDDITQEECQSFLDRHNKDVEAYLATAEQIIAEEKQYNFHYRHSWDDVKAPFGLRTIMGYVYRHRLSHQPKREYVVAFDTISEPKLDLESGRWVTKIGYSYIAKEWTGWRDGKKQHYSKDICSITREVETTARKCNVNFIPYDEYHAMFVPDEAAKAAKDAVDIGMTDLKVALPVVSNGETKRDPIIVGHVKKQMFIIAWFGYDKDHFSCNA